MLMMYVFLCLQKKCSLSFYRKQMKESTTPWNIVFGHHPATLAKAKHKAGFQGFVLRNMFCSDKLDSYIAGHSHHQELRKVDNCTTDFIISGTEERTFIMLKETSNHSFYQMSMALQL